jgi:hypothetical protein
MEMELYKISGSDIITEIKELYHAKIIKKRWRNEINKLDQHLSNYLILQSADSVSIINSLIDSPTDWGNYWNNLGIAVFIYCDFAIWNKLINAGCPFDPYKIVTPKYLIGKTYKYGISNPASLLLKLQYNITMFESSLVKGYSLIYSDSIPIKKFELLYKNKTITKKQLLKPKKPPRFKIFRKEIMADVIS